MKNSLQVHTCSASREMILEVFRDQYRIALEYDPESEPDIPIEFETTVSDLTLAFDWVRPKALGPGLSESFGIEATMDEWLAVLTPKKQRTLGDICDFLVGRGVELPVSRPLRIFGADCDTAGAFLTIRSLLAGEGVEVAGLRPSSKLAAFVGKSSQLDALLLTTNKLAPGILPEPLVLYKKPTLRSVAGWPFLAGLIMSASLPVIMLGSVVSDWLGGPAFPEAALTYLLMALISLFGISLAVWFVIEKIWPTEHIARPGFETFGDLARAVAAYEPPTSSA